MQSLFIFLKYLFIYLFLLCWIFVPVRGLSPVAASGGHSSSRCAGLSLWRPLLLRSTGSRCAGSVIVAHGPSCSAAYGILPDQGSNPCPLHWQADSQPLCHQGSPKAYFLFLNYFSTAMLHHVFSCILTCIIIVGFIKRTLAPHFYPYSEYTNHWSTNINSFDCSSAWGHCSR